MKSLFLLITSMFLLQESPIPVVLGESFVIEKSDVAIFKEGDINVKILAINDSRCPENTNCVWAGELTAEVEVSDSRTRKSHKLVVPALGKSGAKAIVELGVYQLRFEGESPKSKRKKIVKNGEGMKLSFKLVRLE